MIKEYRASELVDYYFIKHITLYRARLAYAVSCLSSSVIRRLRLLFIEEWITLLPKNISFTKTYLFNT